MTNILVPRVGVGVMVTYPPLPGDSDRRPRFAWLHRQGTSHGNDEWSLPGGGLEFNESLIDCARREVTEETGVSKFRAFYRIPFISEDFFPNENMHWVTHYFIAYPEDGEITRLMEPDKADYMAIVFEPPGKAFVGAKEAISSAFAVEIAQAARIALQKGV